MWPAPFRTRLPFLAALVLLAGTAAVGDEPLRLREFDWDAGLVEDAGTAAPVRLFDRLEPMILPPAPEGDFNSSDDWRGQSGGDVETVLVGLPLNPVAYLAGGRVRGEWGSDFGGDERIGGHLLLTTRSLVAFDAEAQQRTVAHPRTGNDNDNEFWNGDANVVFYLPNVKMLSMRAGGGASWLHDDDETDVGWNLTYGAEVILKGPWLLTGEIDYGRLGGERLFHGQATLGLRLSRFEIFTGYDYFDLGRLKVDGLLAGAGVWF